VLKDKGTNKKGKRKSIRGKKEKERRKLREKVGSRGQVRNGTHGLFKPDVQAPERV
jgi:hypothetical protein